MWRTWKRDGTVSGQWAGLAVTAVRMFVFDSAVLPEHLP